jgi:hypothetical protein
VAALYETLLLGFPVATSALRDWKPLVACACGRDVEQCSSAIQQMARRFGMTDDTVRPAEMLFAAQTYYAVVIGRVARQIFRVGGQIDDQALFRWYATVNRPQTERVLAQLAVRVDAYDPDSVRVRGSGDLLGPLYQELFPKQVRHALGEYYTPEWLVRHVLDEVGYAGRPGHRLLDPACGSGSFLIAAIERARAWHAKHSGATGSELGRHVLSDVVGFELNPLAVATARANYLIALADAAAEVDPSKVPVYLRDSILGADDRDVSQRFDVVVGNPPWIAWDHLPAPYREATKPLWRKYGLFTLSGKEARHGGGKKDLSMLMLYVAADRFLKDGGRLGLVITQTVFQTKGAGDGFRQFRLGVQGPELRVLRVHDMADFQPFATAANWTGTITLEKGSATAYPVPYFRWRVAGEPGSVCESATSPRSAPLEYDAEPIDPDRPTSPWFLRPKGLHVSTDRLIGPSDYQAHLGANSGGANSVYWLEVLGLASGGVRVRNLAETGRGSTDCVEDVIEPDLLYPLLRWSDVARFRASPKCHMLLAQDVTTRKGIDHETMRSRYPKTYGYLRRFQSQLARRAAYRRYQHRAPFYSMYNVGSYTVAPTKVVWRRMDRRINASVVQEIDDPLLGPRPVIPQETCVLVAAVNLDEAHYICAVLNSAVAGYLVTCCSVRGGKGFGTPGMLDYIRLRRFDPTQPRHRELATLSRDAHALVLESGDLKEIQHRIDHVAGQLWDLGHNDVNLIRRELEQFLSPGRSS